MVRITLDKKGIIFFCHHAMHNQFAILWMDKCHNLPDPGTLFVQRCHCDHVTASNEGFHTRADGAKTDRHISIQDGLHKFQQS